MVTALLVDDHPLFRDGFAAMLGRHRPGWALQTANTGAEAVAVIMANPSGQDLLIVDIQLPDMDGFEAARRLAEHAPLTPRIMISGQVDEIARRRSRNCGASGFISKAWTPQRVIAMLDAVLDGGLAFEPPDAAASAAALTARQLEVLTLLANGESNKAIEQRMNIAPRTVRAHLTEIFQILEADSRLQAIIKARRLGLVT